MSVFTGTAGNDIFVGSINDDTLRGFAGNDTLDGSFGADSISGGDDNDLLLDGGGSGNDTLTGGLGNDTLTASEGDDSLHGGQGNDLLSGGDGNDTLAGGVGDDTLSGEAGTDLIEGGDGNDRIFDKDPGTLRGGLGDDTIQTIVTTGETALIEGGDGADVFIASGPGGGFNAGRVQVVGGAGIDRFNVVGKGISDGVVPLTGQQVCHWIVQDFDPGVGGDQIDLVTSPALDLPSLLQVSADNGYTGGNPFTLGFLRLTQSDADTLLEWDVNGAAGGESWQTVMTLTGVDTIDITADNFTGAVLLDGPVDDNGTAAADSLLGGLFDDTLGGLAGNDTLDGSFGADSISGGDDNDLLLDGGGSGNDTLLGDLGNDTLTASAGADSLEGGAGADSMRGGDGNDTLLGDAGDDTLSGEAGTDLIEGGDGNDRIFDKDPGTLRGGLGDDTIQTIVTTGETALIEGGDGADVFIASGPGGGFNAGTVQVMGGAGIDRYNVVGKGISDGVVPLTGQQVCHWIVQDFDPGIGGDQIDLVTSPALDLPSLLQVSADNGYTGGNPFTLGFLRLTQSDADTLLEWDINGATGGESWQTVMTLTGVDTIDITADNFTTDIPLTGPGVNQLFNGTAAADSLLGGLFDDTLGGLAGNDTLDGSFGADSISGGDDNDLLLDGGGSGNDTLTGGLGNDTLTASEGDDSLHGGQGNDLLSGGDGNDTLAGGVGDDTLSGEAGTDLIEGGDGNDRIFDKDPGTLRGGLGNDTIQTIVTTGETALIEGGDGADVFIASGPGGGFNAGTVQVVGGAGIDRFNVVGKGISDGVVPLTGQQVCHWIVQDFDPGVGGDQIDLVTSPALDLPSLLQVSADNGYTGGNPFTLGFLRLTQSDADTLLEWDVNGAAGGESWQTVMTLQNVDMDDITADNFAGQLIVGTDDDDSLVGGIGVDTVQGLAGDDTLDGSAGGDSMEGGSGNDVYYVDDAGDLVVETDNNLPGGLILPGLGSGGSLSVLASTLLDGITDTVIAAVNFSIANLDNVEIVTLTGDATQATGNDLANILNGNALANALTALGGEDTVNGGEGNDTLYGNLNDDSLVGGLGDDTLYGGQQNDVADGGDGADRIEGNFGDDTLTGGVGNDAFVHGGQGNDWVYGNTGDDTLFGGLGNDQVFGGQQNDVVSGGDGNDNEQGNLGDDLMAGDAGNDTLHGGQGNDTLVGNVGNDSLVGGLGSDVFRYDAATLNTTDVGANQADIIGATAGDLLSMLGLNDEITINGTALSALTANLAVGNVLNATNNIAFTGGVLQIDLDNNDVFNAANDFQVAITGITTVTYNATTDQFQLA